MGQAESVRLECRFSDQQCAEENLERMRIAPNRDARRLPPVPLSSEVAQGFTSLPRQNNWGDGGTDKPDATDYGGRLIYRGVNLVIGSFGKVSLRDHRNAYHGA